MLKKLVIVLTFVLLNTTLFGQTFVGTYEDSDNCTIRINNDSTINFVHYRNGGCIYGEYTGTIKHIDDSLFHISATMTIGQSYQKSFNLDTFYILANFHALELDTIWIRFPNKTQKHYLGYDKHRQQIYPIKIPINKKVFNGHKGTDIVTITTKRKNFISDNFLTFKIPFGSLAAFSSGIQEDFYVIISKGLLYTTKNELSRIGNFKMKMK